MKRVALIVAAAALIVGATACGDDDGGTQGQDAPVRAENEGFATGQEISITKQGFAPAQLIAAEGEAVVWRNDTDAAVEVQFVGDIAPPSGPIAPGDKFSYTPSSAISLSYFLASDPQLTGAVQVEP